MECVERRDKQLVNRDERQLRRIRKERERGALRVADAELAALEQQAHEWLAQHDEAHHRGNHCNHRQLDAERERFFVRDWRLEIGDWRLEITFKSPISSL